MAVCAADTLRCRAAVQKDPDRRNELTRNTKSSQDKCPVLCLEQETDWECLAGEQICGEGPGGPVGQLGESEPAGSWQQ